MTLFYNIMSSTDFSLYTLNSTTGLYDVSAAAVFYISEQDIQNVFKARTDSADFSDISSADLHYYVNMDEWPSTTLLNPVNGMLDQPLSWNPIIDTGVANQMLIKHDFIRYLASKLFNSANGVFMFNNVSSMISDLEDLGETMYQQDVSASLWKYAATSTTTLETGYVVDSSTGLKATTNENSSIENICYILMKKLLDENIERFDNAIMDASGVFSLPLLEGDTINYLVKLNPSSQQHLLTSVPEFGGRIYQIKLVIDDGTNDNIY
jgi:hypothetical protein